MSEITDLIREKSAHIYAKVRGYREYIHQFPELSYQEVETMKYVSKVLTELAISHQTEVGKTGVVAIIRNDKHSFDAPCVGLRSDLDALPIQEENDISFKSSVDGVMHACGHDVHTAILLGVAEILNEMKDLLPCPVKLIFQPGEENPGGATLMIAMVFCTIQKSKKCMPYMFFQICQLEKLVSKKDFIWLLVMKFI